MKTFVVHLERATARRTHAAAMLELLPPGAQLWPACDGAAMPEKERSDLVAKEALFQPKYPFILSDGEVGCFESHRSLWRHIIEAGLPYALIVEDDVVIDPVPFAQALKLAEAHAGALGYIQLQTRALKSSGQKVLRDGKTALIRPETVPLRTSAQVVSREAAAKLLNASAQIDRPVDVFIQMFWETGVCPHCVVPSGVSDLKVASTVQSKRSFGQKLGAEWSRGRYRTRIKALSRQNV